MKGLSKDVYSYGVSVRILFLRLCIVLNDSWYSAPPIGLGSSGVKSTAGLEEMKGPDWPEDNISNSYFYDWKKLKNY